MKKFATIIVILLLQVSVVKAQFKEEAKVKKWRFSSIAIKVGPDFKQRHSNMSFQTMEKLVKNPAALHYDMKGFKQRNHFFSEMMGETVGTYVNFSKDINGRFSREWQAGLNAYTYAEVYVDYEKEQVATDNYVGWCLLQNRFDLDVAHFVKYNHRRFGLFIGASGSLGTSFNDQVMLFDEEGTRGDNLKPVQITAARSTRFVYAHLIFGLSINLYKGLAFTYELKRGKGVQLGTDNQIASRSGLVGLQYSFNK